MEAVHDWSTAEQLDKLPNVGDDSGEIGEEYAFALQWLLAICPGGLEEQPSVPVRYACDGDALLHRVGHRLLDPRHHRLDHRTREGDVQNVTLLSCWLKLPLALGLHNHRAAVFTDLQEIVDVAGFRRRLCFDRGVPLPVEDLEQKTVEHLQPRVGFVRPELQRGTDFCFELHQPLGREFDQVGHRFPSTAGVAA